MKIHLSLLIFTVSLGILISANFSSANANSHISPGTDPSLPEIRVQLEYRNSDGILIHYMEPTIFYLNNVYLFHDFLDKQENKTIITKDGIDYEKIVFNETFHMKPDRQISQYAIHHKGYVVVNTAHIGFITVESATFDVTWTIVRTIQ